MFRYSSLRMSRMTWGIAFWLVATLTGMAAGNTARDRARLIIENQRYYHGVGYGATLEEAQKSSLADLCGKISLTLALATDMKDTRESEEFTRRGSIATFVTLSNTERLVVSDVPEKYEVLTYIERQQVENDMALRADKIRTLIAQGEEMEGKLEIASALKYYNWAYALARSYARPVKADAGGRSVADAKAWLDSKINTVLSTIRIGLDNVQEAPGEVDPYVVNLTVTYLGQPVADLDFDYTNHGLRVRDQHVKNGCASLPFQQLPSDNIDLGIKYRYEKEGAQYDAELQTVYAAHNAHSFPKASILVPCRGTVPEKFAIQERKLTRQERRQTEADAGTAPPIVAPLRQRVEAQTPGDSRAHHAVAVMDSIERAIATRQYPSVRRLFTADGFRLFSMMMQSGRVTCRKTGGDRKVELAGEYVVGKSVPVSIKYKGGHTVAEDIVFRFNADNLVESVAYALTRRAEDDIFRQNSWELPARYAILRFMEDYQTAYAMKNLPYLEKIFSDDAVIITGKANAGKRRQGDGQYFLTDSFTYTREDKQTYLDRLRRQFAEKDYIKLTFEDNEIREQSGLYDNIFWIEIKQFYSSSNYNDVGYLTLMIDMREADPTIKVRTWAPGKVPLPELMRRYTVN